MDAASLRDLVREEARKQGVDEKAALAILSQESTDGEQVNSPKGARGPMQLMPATAVQYGVKDICNPVENVRGGVAFLKDLMAQFQGNLMLVAAAYNAGSERVYRSNGVPPNAETVRYVASVTNKYYGLGELAARRGKSGPKGEANGSALWEASRAPASNPGSSKGQEWIGGSVLYVSSDEEGDGR
jgi:soluble lytic murein transglycosylase-like protein